MDFIFLHVLHECEYFFRSHHLVKEKRTLHIRIYHTVTQSILYTCMHAPSTIADYLLSSNLCEASGNEYQPKTTISWMVKKIKLKKIICDRFLCETNFCLDWIGVYSSAIHTGTMFKCSLNHSQSFTIKLTFYAILYILKVAHNIRFLPNT